MEDELATYGFGPDDVAWEATYAGGADGWVIAFHDDVAVTQVQRRSATGSDRWPERSSTPTGWW